MGFSTHSEVCDYIRTYLARSDAPIEDFIPFAEAELAGIRHYRMEKRTRVSKAVNANSISLPDDYIEMRSLTLNGEPLSLVSAKRKTPLDLRSYYNLSGSIIVNPLVPASERFELTYLARVPALTPSAPTNWLLRYYPNVYLHAILVHAYQWLRDMEGENASRNRLGEALALLDRDHKRARYSGNTISGGM